jgi:curved DNA-binding protein CbpA
MQRTTISLLDALNTFGYASKHDVTAAQLKRDYRRLAKAFHPDHGGNAAKFDQLVKANERLLLLLTDTAFDSMFSAPPKHEEPKAEEPSGKRPRPSEARPRCGKATKSGPCIRPEGHPHGCMSEEVYNRKRAAQKAKKAA